jgi:hypothetical protein
MSRPKPKVLLTHTNSSTYISDQVLAVRAIYTICYDGKPISVKSVHSLLSDQAPRYRRTCFPESPGHAFNLAEKLNALFHTDRFSVFEMVPAAKVLPNKS